MNYLGPLSSFLSSVKSHSDEEEDNDVKTLQKSNDEKVVNGSREDLLVNNRSPDELSKVGKLSTSEMVVRNLHNSGTPQSNHSANDTEDVQISRDISPVPKLTNLVVPENVAF